MVTREQWNAVYYTSGGYDFVGRIATEIQMGGSGCNSEVYGPHMKPSDRSH